MASDALVRKEVLIASRKGELDTIKGLFELHGVTVVNVQDEITGNSVLFIAAASGYLTLVQFLVTNGADLHKINNRGQSILTTAAANGCYHLLSPILTLFSDHYFLSVMFFATEPSLRPYHLLTPFLIHLISISFFYRSCECCHVSTRSIIVRFGKTDCSNQ